MMTRLVKHVVVFRARLAPRLFEELAIRFAASANHGPLRGAAVVVDSGFVGLFLFLIRDLRSICLASLPLHLNPVRTLLPFLLSLLLLRLATRALRFICLFLGRGLITGLNCFVCISRAVCVA